LQSKLLCNLYELICESCGYEYFSAYDPFQSIGIEQSTFYLSDLYETEEGISFYHKYYHEDKEEIKLYVLIRILFELRDKENIEKEIEKAINRGIKIRSKLVDLLNEIKRNGKLPRYMG